MLFSEQVDRLRSVCVACAKHTNAEEARQQPSTTNPSPRRPYVHRRTTLRDYSTERVVRTSVVVNFVEFRPETSARDSFSRRVGSPLQARERGLGSNIE